MTAHEADAIRRQMRHLGSRDRTAALILQDFQGRPRLRLSVDSLGAARIEFLSEDGAVVRTIPE